jgi:hypothetical protein
MAAFALLDAEILAGPLRMGTVSNQVSVGLEADQLDVTVFTSGGWSQSIAGLRDATVETSGFFDAAAPETGALGPDAELWAGLGGGQMPVTISPNGADLSTAYIVPTRRGEVTLYGKVGEVAPFASTMWGDGAVARGQLIHPANVIRSAGGTGSTAVLGTIPAGRFLLVAVHVLTITGTTPALTITVQRDDNAGFTSPTTVATMGPVSAPSSSTASLTPVPGPITPDDRYRVTWTLTGTTPTARFAVAVGITP